MIKHNMILIFELNVLVKSIHMVSSILWWSITLFVISIIRPHNKTGTLSIVLPKVHKTVMYVSTISISSGIFFYLFNSNFQFYKLINTLWGNFILLSGLLSLSVYYHILSNGKKVPLNIKLKRFKRFNYQKPIILFSMLTISLMLMIFTSEALFR